MLAVGHKCEMIAARRIYNQKFVRSSAMVKWWMVYWMIHSRVGGARLRRVCGAFAARMTHVYVFMRNRQYIYCDNDEKSPVYILRQWSDRHYCPAKRLGLNEKIRTARFFSFLDFVLSEASGIQWKNVKLLKNACFCDFSNRGQCWNFSAPKFVKYFEVF